jgi:hypothetical protein
MEQKTGTVAAGSIVAAVLCYVAICSGHPWWGLAMGIVSIPLGLIGLLWSASPRVSGGILSIFAMLLGAVGIVLSILAGIGAILISIG